MCRLSSNSFRIWAIAGLLLSGAIAVAVPPGLRDVEVTVYVRRALDKDVALAEWNVIVLTHAGRVTLRGQVPKREMAQRAERMASLVQGVLEVDNRIQVVEGLVHWQKEDWALGGAVAMEAPGQPKEEAILPWWRSESKALAQWGTRSAFVGQPSTLGLRPLHQRSTEATVSLMPPRRSLSLPEPSGSLVSAKKPSESELANRIEKLRLSHRLYRNLRITEDNGIITIQGSAKTHAIVTHIATIISTYPGTKRVRIRDIEIE